MDQAVILAGGRATRMRPYTDERPKAMIEIAGVPIIEHQIRWLAANEVRKIVISCGYRAEVIEERLGDGSKHGVSVTYAHEKQPLGRGGGLRFAAGYLPDMSRQWLALNGDVICDFPVEELIALHRKSGALATIALAQYESTWGIVELDGDLVKNFVQSPKLPYWINAGVYCFEPEVTELLPVKGDHEDKTFPDLAQEGKLAGYKISGRWRGIDTAKDVLEATKELEKLS